MQQKIRITGSCLYGRAGQGQRPSRVTTISLCYGRWPRQRPEILGREQVRSTWMAQHDGPQTNSLFQSPTLWPLSQCMQQRKPKNGMITGDQRRGKMSTEPGSARLPLLRSQSDITRIALLGNDAEVDSPGALTECSTETYLLHESWTVHKVWYEQDIATCDGHWALLLSQS